MKAELIGVVGVLVGVLVIVAVVLAIRHHDQAAKHDVDCAYSAVSTNAGLPPTAKGCP